MQRSITLPNDIATIPQLSEFVETVCEEMGLDMAIMMNLNLAIEEAVVNVMSYAYPNGKGDVTVDIKVDSEKVMVILTDSGTPWQRTLSTAGWRYRMYPSSWDTQTSTRPCAMCT